METKQTGASNILIPMEKAVCANFFEAIGSIVEQSITMDPFLRVAKTPFGPFKIDSTCFVAGNIVIMTSEEDNSSIELTRFPPSMITSGTISKHKS